MALKILMLRRKVSQLQAEAAELRKAESGYRTREAALAAQIEAATDAELPELSAAVEELETAQKTTKERLETIQSEVDAALADIEAAEQAAEAAAGGGGDEGGSEPTASRSKNPRNHTRAYPLPWLERASAAWQRRCAEFKRTGSMAYETVQSLLTRAALLSSDTIGPTGVGGINEAVGSVPSSFIDMVTVTDCTGMSSYQIAYEDEVIEVSEGTEGTESTESSPTFGFVELTPSLYDVISYVSKYILKFTPLRYEEAVRKQISKALRARVSAMAIDKLLESTLTDSLDVTGATGNAVFTPNFLSNIQLSYGGDESVEGEAVLIMNKKDLLGFTSVRGVNEYIPAYSYTPDAGNSSTGILKAANGPAVRYCLNKNIPALYGATLTGTARKFMAYGDPKNLELALWGGFEVDVSKDYKFGQRLISVSGDVNADAAVNKKHGFVVVSATLSV